MTQTFIHLILPIAVILYTMVATLDVCLCALNKIELKKLARKGGQEKSFENIVHFLEVHQDASIALQLSRQILLILIVMMVVYSFVCAGVPHPYLISVGTMVVAMLIFGQLVPRTFAYRIPDRAILFLAPPFQRFYFLLLPLILPFRKMKQVWVREKRDAAIDDEDITAFIKVGTEEGILQEGEEKLIKSVVDFGDRLVREVMTPRIEIVAIREDSTVGDLRRIVVEEKHSRIPVYSEALDNISGMVLARDLVHMLSVTSPNDVIRPLVRQAYFVPETKKVSELLAEFQRLRLSLAVVVNEYGGVSGLVTIEDLLEEIVGEIKDEYDEDREQIVGDGGKGYVVAGSMELAKVGEFFQVNLTERSAEANTIGGLVSAVAGRVLAEGEAIEHAGLRFEVLQGDRRKIQKVRIRKIQE
ncbi:MAG: HlyC/CorC family transporter [Acidobacteria bacterium]|nr:HlyC/CorC family transporter [Acidobacteriota bacterium]